MMRWCWRKAYGGFSSISNFKVMKNILEEMDDPETLWHTI